MEILEKKFVRRVVCFVAFVLLPFTMVAIGVESKWEEQEPLLAFLIGLGEINQEMAELLRQNCRLELLHAKKILQDLELHYEKTSGNDEELLNDKLSKKKLCDMVNVLRLQVKQILVECLREKNIVLPRTGEQKGSDTWYTRYLGLVPTRLFSSRRRELDQASGLALPDSNDPSFQTTGDENDQSSTQEMIIIIAVVATALVTFILAALLFCCCCGARSRRGRYDEKPLLSLSLSDYSSGTPANEEKFGNQSFSNKLSQNKNSGNFYMESDALSSSKIEIPLGENPLPPPPGVSGPPRLPQLRPPPGRTYSPRPEPMNTAPPPAVAPPPLPAKPSPGGSRPPPAGPPPPPLPSGPKAGPRPPPPPGGGPPPPRPPGGLKAPRAPQGPKRPSASEEGEDDGSKTKLKPFFWDKVTASPDNSMVWNDIKSGSFQFNEEMIESLFGYAPDSKNKNEAKKGPTSQEPSPQFIQIIDPKKAQNLSILLKALNVTTEEVCDALEEGNELPQELMQTLLRMAPTPQEELKLRLYNGEVSHLGPVERFLKVLVDIPFAFKRLETLLFMCSLQEETSMLKDSFGVLESACTELRKSRLFLKLLEAVLKTGNRMNDGTFRGGAQAFKLDTLLKLADVRGADGKTTLLHFVVQEIIRSEGIRAARAAKEIRSMSSFKSEDLNEEPTDDSDDQLRSMGLQVVSGLSNELENVKKASILDADNITGTVAKLGHALLKARDFLNSDMKSVPEENGFHQGLKSFVETSETDVTWLLEEEKRIMALVKSTADYFHGNAGKDEGLRLFVIVRDFLVILDKVCKEVKNAPMKTSRTNKKEDTSTDTSTAPADKGQNNPANPRHRLFPAITDRRMDNSSSDDES